MKVVGCEVMSGERAGRVCLCHALSRHGRWPGNDLPRQYINKLSKVKDSEEQEP